MSPERAKEEAAAALGSLRLGDTDVVISVVWLDATCKVPRYDGMCHCGAPSTHTVYAMTTDARGGKSLPVCDRHAAAFSDLLPEMESAPALPEIRTGIEDAFEAGREQERYAIAARLRKYANDIAGAHTRNAREMFVKRDLVRAIADSVEKGTPLP